MWATFMVVLMFILLPISMTIEYIQRFKSFSAGEFLNSLEIGVNIYGSSFKCAFTMIDCKKRQEENIGFAGQEMHLG